MRMYRVTLQCILQSEVLVEAASADEAMLESLDHIDEAEPIYEVDFSPIDVAEVMPRS